MSLPLKKQLAVPVLGGADGQNKTNTYALKLRSARTQPRLNPAANPPTTASREIASVASLTLASRPSPVTRVTCGGDREPAFLPAAAADAVAVAGGRLMGSGRVRRLPERPKVASRDG